MATSTYDRLLGLPGDVVTPDYVQLLGLPPDDDWSEAEVTAALADRLDRLSRAPDGDRAVVEHLRRELQRARATLLDPGALERHRAEVEQRRLKDLSLLAARQLGAARSLPLAVEQALLEAARTWGLSADAARATLEGVLTKRGAAKGSGPAPSLPALHAARERLRRAMVELVDERLREQAGVRSTEPAGTARLRSTPSRPPAALSATAASRPVGRQGDDDEDEHDASEVHHWSPRAAAPAATRDAASEPAEAKASAARAGATTTSATSATSATPWPTIVRGEERAALERRARRWRRAWMALAAIAGAFVLGDVAAAFAPAEAAWLDARTAAAREAFVTSPRRTELVMASLGAAAALLGLLVWLAGREARRPFLAPLGLLALPACLAGLLPIGHERDLPRAYEAALAQRDAVNARALAAAGERDAARRRAAAAAADVTSLAAALATAREELAARARRVTTLEGWLRRYAAERRAQREELRGLRGQVAALEREVADLRSSSVGAATSEAFTRRTTSPGATVDALTRRTEDAVEVTRPRPGPAASTARTRP